MSSYTAKKVPTQFVEANGIRFAYRRWGKRSGLPLVFNQLCLPKIRSAQGSKLFFQTNRKGRWACGPCLNLVNQIRCDVHLCASTLLTRKSESQYRQG